MRLESAGSLLKGAAALFLGRRVITAILDSLVKTRRIRIVFHEVKTGSLNLEFDIFSDS